MNTEFHQNGFMHYGLLSLTDKNQNHDQTKLVPSATILREYYLAKKKKRLIYWTYKIHSHTEGEKNTVQNVI